MISLHFTKWLSVFACEFELKQQILNALLISLHCTKWLSVFACESEEEAGKTKYLIEEKGVATLGRRSEAMIGERERVPDVRDGTEEGFTRIDTTVIRACCHRLESFHYLGGPE